MGWIVHEAVIVTSFDEKAINLAHKEALRIFNGYVTELIRSPVNTWWSFLIPPDGSKEGWDASHLGDARRDEFRRWVLAQAFEDGSNLLDVVAVAYGELDRAIITAVDGHETGADARRR